jgi:hypothetical protein
MDAAQERALDRDGEAETVAEENRSDQRISGGIEGRRTLRLAAAAAEGDRLTDERRPRSPARGEALRLKRASVPAPSRRSESAGVPSSKVRTCSASSRTALALRWRPTRI